MHLRWMIRCFGGHALKQMFIFERWQLVAVNWTSHLMKPILKYVWLRAIKALHYLKPEITRMINFRKYKTIRTKSPNTRLHLLYNSYSFSTVLFINGRFKFQISFRLNEFFDTCSTMQGALWFACLRQWFRYNIQNVSVKIVTISWIIVGLLKRYDSSEKTFPKKNKRNGKSTRFFYRNCPNL